MDTQRKPARVAPLEHPPSAVAHVPPRHLGVRVSQRKRVHRELLTSGKAGAVNGHVAAAARGRNRALQVTGRAGQFVYPEVGRRARGIGACVLPGTGLGF